MLSTGLIFLLLVLFAIIAGLWGHVNLLRGRQEGMLQMMKMAEVAKQLASLDVTKINEHGMDILNAKELKKNDSGAVEDHPVGK